MSLAGIIHTTEGDDIRVDSEATLRREPLEKGELVGRNRAFLEDACQAAGRRCHDVPQERTGPGADAACLCFRNNRRTS